MVKVAGVKFKTAGKVYYFDPGKLDIKLGDNVIVETIRGLELGKVSAAVKEVNEKDVVSPLKSILRVATDKDLEKYKQNLAKRSEALKLCQEKIDKHKLEMKLVDVEYTFDKNKIIFYFTADGRVDFRELVKDLAGVFRVRIELRQVGVRDEARLMGGIGACGCDLCCNKWLSEFQPVSIKMAKSQNLSLNPTKISGICGRLMCCLNYENDNYVELRKGLPDVGEKVKIDGEIGKVVDNNILKSQVKVRMVEGKDEEGNEILSEEMHTFDKKEVKRFQRKKKKEDVFEDIDEETKKEIEKISKE